MEGRRNTTLNSERPISKPRFPLSLDFGPPKKETELLIEKVALKDQRAYFYRKETTESGAPIYDFVITADDDSSESH